MASDLVNHLADGGAYPASQSRYSRRVRTIPDRIRWILTTKKLSQRELSLRAGLSHGAVGYILRSEGSSPEADTLKALAKAAGVSAPWLITGEGAPDATEEPQRHPANDTVPAATMGERPGYDDTEADAKALDPAITEPVWETIRAGDPLLTVPLTPIMLVELARFYMRHQGRRRGDGRPGGPRRRHRGARVGVHPAPRVARRRAASRLKCAAIRALGACLSIWPRA